MISLRRYVDKINREASVDDKLVANVETIFQLIRRKASVDAFRATIDEFADLVVMHVSPMEHDRVVMRGAVQAAMERLVSYCLMRDGRHPPRIDESERALVGDLLDTLRLDEGAALDATTVDYGESVLDAVAHSTNLFTASRTSDENGRPPPIATTPPLLGGGGRYNGPHPEQWKVRFENARKKWDYPCKAWRIRQEHRRDRTQSYQDDDLIGERCLELVARVGYAGGDHVYHEHALNNAQSDELFRQCLETDGTKVNRTCDDGLEPLDWRNLEYREKECIDDRFAVPSEMKSNLRDKVNKVLKPCGYKWWGCPDGSDLKALGDTLDNMDRARCPTRKLRNKVNKVLEPHKDTTPHRDGSRVKELGDTLDTTPTVFTLSNVVTIVAVVQAIGRFFRKTHRRQRAKAMLQHTLHSVFGH